MLNRPTPALTPVGVLLADEAAAVSFSTTCTNLSGVILWLVLGLLVLILYAFFDLLCLVVAMPKQTRTALCSPYTVAVSCLIMNATLLAPLCFTV